MARSVGQKQMVMLAWVTGLMTAATLTYMLVRPPAYLHRTRTGVAYFTPPVINPAGGKPLNVNRLAEYYRGNNDAGLYATTNR